MLVRPAKSGDVHDILAIKTALSIRPDQAPHSGGGFLLDSDVERIRRHIEEDILLVVEDPDDKRLAGFALVFRHETVMSDIWPRRGKAALNISEEFLTQAKVSWFDKLGMRTGLQYRRHAPLLALKATQLALEEHTLIGAAVMTNPAPNVNSLRLLGKAGFQTIGSITEDYPGVGNMTSDIYVVDRETFRQTISAPALKRMVDWVEAREPSAARPIAATA
ncbi:MAG: hypothetical protein K8F25_09630 [Fimbriimonadaceae bacterium]|nr:hypothetical protein [Alphaproteobacteria bacterium]